MAARSELSATLIYMSLSEREQRLSYLTSILRKAETEWKYIYTCITTYQNLRSYFSFSSLVKAAMRGGVFVCFFHQTSALEHGICIVIGVSVGHERGV